MKEYTAKTVDEAVKIASEELGIDENDLIFTVTSEKKGLIGKKASITVYELTDAIEFAEKYVLHYSQKCDYIATAEILDEEMAERVRLHRERRDARWINYEAPSHAEETFAALGDESKAVLFDCLTIYMCNLFYGKEAPEHVYEYCKSMVEAVAKAKV